MRWLLVIVAGVSGVGGYGFVRDGGSGASVSFDQASSFVRTSYDQSKARGSLRAVKWDVVRRAESSIQLGAFVSYCESGPEPRIERIERRRRPGSVVLTMFVHFPPRRGDSCAGFDLGVSHWVRLGRRWTKLEIYDGSTSPPSLREGANAPPKRRA